MSLQTCKAVLRLFLLSLLFGQLAFAQKSPIKGLDEYIAKAMKEWETPGLAIAIVKGDEIVFARGYGVRKLGETDKVTEQTIFAVASTTKAMTAACIGMLVDEGKLKWDDPVTKYLSWFQLSDPYVTREMTVRDLLTHRSGLERGDLLWYTSPHSREEVIRRLRYLKPAWSFRSRYGYQNIMYMTAGEVIKVVSGKTWDAFIRERLFAPLGMNSSVTSITDLGKFEDVASPHDKIDEKMQPIRRPNFDNVGSAGSVNSCVMDMAQWIRLNLGGGIYKGTKILSPDVARELHTPQTVIRLDSLALALRPSTHFAAYGLGWSLSDYQGRKLIQHDGALDGMRARVALIPEEKLGLVILINSEMTSLHGAISYRIYDHYLGAPARDWSAELLKIYRDQEAKNKADEKKKEEERVQGTKPSLPLEKYTGTYENEMYGPLKVAVANDKLVLSFYDSYVGDLSHWHFDTFQSVWRDQSFGKGFVAFTLDFNGKIEYLKWQGVADFKRTE